MNQLYDIWLEEIESGNEVVWDELVMCAIEQEFLVMENWCHNIKKHPTYTFLWSDDGC